MSYDLRIWSVSPVSLSDSLSESEWHAAARGWVTEGAQWQVSVGPSDHVLPEDVPDDAKAILPGIAYLTELNLSPINAGVPARRFLTRTARALAKAAYGVVEDPQDDTIIAPAG